MSAELEARLSRLRAFGGLRRALRKAEDVDAIARASVAFATDVLGCARAALFCAEKEASDFTCLASSDAELAPTIERASALVQRLESEPWVRDDANSSLALRSGEGHLVGILRVGDAPSEQELLDELAFDVESVLSARLMSQLRAEELAVLEIQERELVGLLRDVEARDEIIQRDLEEARRFQRQMLGHAPRIAGSSIEVVYAPLGLVGGDLYAVTLDGQRVRLLVADATGHGVRASLTTMMIKSGYEAVRRTATDPAMLLAALNETIAHTYRSAEMLFSAACVDLDLATGRMMIASAAHPPICIVKNAEAQMLEGGGAFLGLKPGMKFKLQECQIGVGDGVFLYTDGFTEARKAGGEQFGEDRFMATILDANRRGVPAGEAVSAAVTAFLEGAPMEDDGAFVGLRYGVDDTSQDSAPPPSVRFSETTKT